MSADAVAAAVTLTNDCIKDGNAVEATSKAAASAWRASQVCTACPAPLSNLRNDRSLNSIPELLSVISCIWTCHCCSIRSALLALIQIVMHGDKCVSFFGEMQCRLPQRPPMPRRAPCWRPSTPRTLTLPPLAPPRCPPLSPTTWYAAYILPVDPTARTLNNP